MRYGRLSDDVLDIKLYEAYDDKAGFKEVTVRDVLDYYGEDIICSDYETNVEDNEASLIKFTAWTRYTVFQLVEDGVDKDIIAIPRHPYSFLYRKQ